jgi:hypothetical protein
MPRGVTIIYDCGVTRIQIYDEGFDGPEIAAVVQKWNAKAYMASAQSWLRALFNGQLRLLGMDAIARSCVRRYGRHGGEFSRDIEAWLRRWQGLAFWMAKSGRELVQDGTFSAATCC